MNIAIGNSIKELENPVVNLSFSKYFPEKIKNDCIIITFALTVHATLPIRTASRGVSFTFRSFFKIQRLHFFISLFANWLFYIRMQYNKPAFTIPQQTVNHTYLPSWLQSISQIRNICAHHGRLWNKNLPGRPKLLLNPPNTWISDVPPAKEHHMLYIHLCCMKYLLNIISPGNHFTPKLAALFSKYPNIDPKALGMKADW